MVIRLNPGRLMSDYFCRFAAHNHLNKSIPYGITVNEESTGYLPLFPSLSDLLPKGRSIDKNKENIPVLRTFD